MTQLSHPAIVYGADPLSISLTVRGPRTPAISGEPVESVHVWHDDGRARTGVWECTPGSFESARRGDTEVMHFVAGAGTITSADGTTYEIRPGAVIVAPDGWSGVWDIRETARKVYTIWSTVEVSQT
ncbi:MAG: DUF861 domain-containing protein [Actinobacteria bacterium]|nr:DUF861 domain-containing protein [Actinomycetota bacterium]